MDLVEKRQDELPPLKRVIYARPQPDAQSEVVTLVGFEDHDVDRGPRFFVEVDPSTGEYERWHCFDPEDLLLEEPFNPDPALSRS